MTWEASGWFSKNREALYALYSALRSDNAYQLYALHEVLPFKKKYKDEEIGVLVPIIFARSNGKPIRLVRFPLKNNRFGIGRWYGFFGGIENIDLRVEIIKYMF